MESNKVLTNENPSESKKDGVWNKILSFMKKYIRQISYSMAGVMTTILAIVLLVWTLQGEALDSIGYIDATVVKSDSVRSEYLVGQEFKMEGYSLDLGDGRLIPSSDCKASVDLSSAGEKSVEISYTEGNLVYRGYVDVDVIYVRGFTIEKYPSVIEVNADGVSLDDEFLMYALLASRPRTDDFGEVEETDYGYRIWLDSSTNTDAYSLSCQRDATKDGMYNMTIYCGTLSSSFSFYNAAGRSFMVDSSSNVVEFSAREEDTETSLTLVVTERSDDYQVDCTGTTKGYYVYRDADGGETLYDFSYEMKDREEVFSSSSMVEESVVDDGYQVTIDGSRYVATSSAWQRAVVNGTITKDGGYNLVIGSEVRILPFEYQTDTESESSPSLTLYVTDYELNPKLGTGSGYSKGVYIYTDEDGNSTKMRFDMTIVSWTFIPLSNAVSDVYSDVTVGWDYTYNESAPDEFKYDSYYLGDLYAQINVYRRGEGVETQLFKADQSVWLKAVAGL